MANIQEDYSYDPISRQQNILNNFSRGMNQDLAKMYTGNPVTAISNAQSAFARQASTTQVDYDIRLKKLEEENLQIRKVVNLYGRAVEDLLDQLAHLKKELNVGIENNQVLV